MLKGMKRGTKKTGLFAAPRKTMTLKEFKQCLKGTHPDLTHLRDMRKRYQEREGRGL